MALTRFCCHGQEIRLRKFIKTSLLSKRSDISQTSWEKVAVLLFESKKLRTNTFSTFLMEVSIIYIGLYIIYTLVSVG